MGVADEKHVFSFLANGVDFGVVNFDLAFFKGLGDFCQKTGNVFGVDC